MRTKKGIRSGEFEFGAEEIRIRSVLEWKCFQKTEPTQKSIFKSKKNKLVWAVFEIPWVAVCVINRASGTGIFVLFPKYPYQGKDRFAFVVGKDRELLGPLSCLRNWHVQASLVEFEIADYGPSDWITSIH